MSTYSTPSAPQCSQCVFALILRSPTLATFFFGDGEGEEVGEGACFFDDEATFDATTVAVTTPAEVGGTAL